MVREIISEYEGTKSATILIHRYNSRDDIFIEYYRVNHPEVVVYKNKWVASGYTKEYKKKILEAED